VTVDADFEISPPNDTLNIIANNETSVVAADDPGEAVKKRVSYCLSILLLFFN